jgi:hypothetical protein
MMGAGIQRPWENNPLRLIMSRKEIHLRIPQAFPSQNRNRQHGQCSDESARLPRLHSSEKRSFRLFAGRFGWRFWTPELFLFPSFHLDSIDGNRAA